MSARSFDRARPEPVSLEHAGQMIAGMLHRPAGQARQPRPAVLLLHGFMAAKSQPPHRLFVHLAQRLVEQGMVVLRIDFRGRGDSEGDARAGLAFLAEQPDVDAARLGLVGISWGGEIAAALAGEDRRVAAVACVSSVPSDIHDWRPTLRDFDGRRAAEAWGNLVGEQFYAALPGFNALTSLKRTRARVLLAYGTADDSIPAGAAERLGTELALSGIRTDVHAIPDADHVFFAYEKQMALLAHLAGWLGQTLNT